MQINKDLMYSTGNYTQYFILIYMGEGNGNPLQYTFLENPMDGGAWRATVHRVAKESDTTSLSLSHGKIILKK